MPLHHPRPLHRLGSSYAVHFFAQLITTIRDFSRCTATRQNRQLARNAFISVPLCRRRNLGPLAIITGCPLSHNCGQFKYFVNLEGKQPVQSTPSTVLLSPSPVRSVLSGIGGIVVPVTSSPPRYMIDTSGAKCGHRQTMASKIPCAVLYNGLLVKNTSFKQADTTEAESWLAKCGA